MYGPSQWLKISFCSLFFRTLDFAFKGRALHGSDRYHEVHEANRYVVGLLRSCAGQDLQNILIQAKAREAVTTQITGGM